MTLSNFGVSIYIFEIKPIFQFVSETESLKKIIELMKKKQEIVATDEAKENAIIDHLERGGMGDIFKETCEFIRQT